MTDKATCPACGSHHLRTPKEGGFVCEVCGHTFGSPAAAPVEAAAPAAATPRREPRGPGAGLTWAIVAVILVVGGLGAWALWPTDDGATTPRDPRLAGSTVPDERRVRLREAAEKVAEVNHTLPPVSMPEVMQGKTDDGRPFWLGIIRNDGRAPIVRPGLVAKVYEGSDRVGRFEGRAPVVVLDPKQTVMTLVSTPGGVSFTNSEVALQHVSEGEKGHRHAMLIADRAMEVGGAVIGEIRNDRDDRVMVRQIVAEGYDAEGRPVAFGVARLDPPVIQPGASVKAQVAVDEFVISPATRWRIYAVGKGGPGKEAAPEE